MNKYLNDGPVRGNAGGGRNSLRDLKNIHKKRKGSGKHNIERRNIEEKAKLEEAAAAEAKLCAKNPEQGEGAITRARSLSESPVTQSTTKEVVDAEAEPFTQKQTEKVVDAEAAQLEETARFVDEVKGLVETALKREESLSTAQPAVDEMQQVLDHMDALFAEPDITGNSNYDKLCKEFGITDLAQLMHLANKYNKGKRPKHQIRLGNFGDLEQKQFEALLVLSKSYPEDLETIAAIIPENKQGAPEVSETAKPKHEQSIATSRSEESLPSYAKAMGEEPVAVAQTQEKEAVEVEDRFEWASTKKSDRKGYVSVKKFCQDLAADEKNGVTLSNISFPLLIKKFNEELPEYPIAIGHLRRGDYDLKSINKTTGLSPRKQKALKKFLKANPNLFKSGRGKAQQTPKGAEAATTKEVDSNWINKLKAQVPEDFHDVFDDANNAGLITPEMFAEKSERETAALITALAVNRQKHRLKKSDDTFTFEALHKSNPTALSIMNAFAPNPRDLAIYEQIIKPEEKVYIPSRYLKTTDDKDSDANSVYEQARLLINNMPEGRRRIDANVKALQGMYEGKSLPEASINDLETLVVIVADGETAGQLPYFYTISEYENVHGTPNSGNSLEYKKYIKGIDKQLNK